MLPALAGGIDQAQLCHRSTCGGGGAGAAGGTGLALAVKAVVVPALSLQALGQHMHAVAAFGRGKGLALAHDLVELGVMGQLPVHRLWAQQRRMAAGQQARPQHDAAGIGLATGNPYAKQLLGYGPGGHLQTLGMGIAAHVCGQPQRAQALKPLAPAGVGDAQVWR